MVESHHKTIEQLESRVDELEAALRLLRSQLVASIQNDEWARLAIVAIQEVLGTMPQGDMPTVRDRIQRLEGFALSPK